MASSISHDLRHPMTAIMANAEFLCENHLDARQREELYHEIRIALDQMMDLVDSLLEFSRAGSQLHPVFTNLEQVVQRAIRAIRSRPEFNCITISFSREGRDQAWFDPKKLERVFHNLLLNACEAIAPRPGHIGVDIRGVVEALEIRVCDDGPGIPENVRERLFQPFVSYGKENGTGLGLAVTQKIIQDHGGAIVVESTSTGRTIFKIVLPVQGFVNAVRGNLTPQPLQPR